MKLLFIETEGILWRCKKRYLSIKVYFPLSAVVSYEVTQFKRNFKIILYNCNCYFYHKQITTNETDNRYIVNIF